MGKVCESDCIFCALNHVHHKVFVCDRWKHKRQTLDNAMGHITPELILQSEHHWENEPPERTAYIVKVLKVLRQKKKAENGLSRAADIIAEST